MVRIKAIRVWIISTLFLLLVVSPVDIIKAGDPVRPNPIPATAVWVGGPDGGVWIVLHRSDKDSPGTYLAKVYHQSGDLEYQGPLVLKPAGLKPLVVNPAEFEGWDGDEMLLSHGRSLKIP